MLFSTQFEKKKAEDKEMNQNSRSVLRTAPQNYEITSAMVMINDIIVKKDIKTNDYGVGLSNLSSDHTSI